MMGVWGQSRTHQPLTQPPSQSHTPSHTPSFLSSTHRVAAQRELTPKFAGQLIQQGGDGCLVPHVQPQHHIAEGLRAARKTAKDISGAELG